MFRRPVAVAAKFPRAEIFSRDAGGDFAKIELRSRQIKNCRPPHRHQRLAVALLDQRADSGFMSPQNPALEEGLIEEWERLELR